MAETMRWTTIYITGRPGFADEVARNLEQSHMPFMEGTPEGDDLFIFWMDDRTDLRSFKKAIGAKTVLKYRLRFFWNRDDYLKLKHVLPADARFTAREEELLREVKAGARKRRRGPVANVL